jgi:hypothetical protein
MVDNQPPHKTKTTAQKQKYGTAHSYVKAIFERELN